MSLCCFNKWPGQHFWVGRRVGDKHNHFVNQTPPLLLKLNWLQTVLILPLVFCSSLCFTTINNLFRSHAAVSCVALWDNIYQQLRNQTDALCMIICELLILKTCSQLQCRVKLGQSWSCVEAELAEWTSSLSHFTFSKTTAAEKAEDGGVKWERWTFTWLNLCSLVWEQPNTSQWVKLQTTHWPRVHFSLLCSYCSWWCMKKSPLMLPEHRPIRPTVSRLRLSDFVSGDPSITRSDTVHLPQAEDIISSLPCRHPHHTLEPPEQQVHSHDDDGFRWR